VQALTKASSSSVQQLQLRQLQADMQAKVAAMQEKEELVQHQQGVIEQLRHEGHHLQAALEAAQVRLSSKLGAFIHCPYFEQASWEGGIVADVAQHTVARYMIVCRMHVLLHQSVLSLLEL
jgi:hypothetical protein